MMTGFQSRQLLLLPFILAFVLRRAHDPLNLLALFFISGACWRLLERFEPKRTLPFFLIAPFLLFFLWCWAALFQGAPLDTFLFVYARLFLYFMTGILVFRYTEPTIYDKFEKLLVLLGCVEAIFIFTGFFRGKDPQFEGYLGNPLHSGLLLPVSVGAVLTWIERRTLSPRQTIGLICVVGLLLMAVFLIRSRTAIIAMGAFMLYLHPRKAAVLLIVFIAVMVGWYALDKSAFLIHFQMYRFQIGSTLGRFVIWATALDAVRAHPIVGCGLGNFEMVYQLFQHPSSEIIQYGKSTMFAHNGFLQIASEAGLPGAITVFWGFFNVLKFSSPLFKQEKLLVLIVIVFAVTSTVNYTLFHPFSGLILSVTLALLAAKASDTCSILKHSVHNVKLRFMTVGIMAGLALFLVSDALSTLFQRKGRFQWAVRACPFRAEAWYELALSNIAQSKDPLFALNRALRWNPQDCFVWHRKALVLAVQANGSDDEINLCFKKAQNLAPSHAPFYLEEAFYRLARHEWGAARLLFEKTASLEPAAPIPHYGLSIVLDKIGNPRGSKAELTIARELKKRQQELEEDPIYKLVYRTMFSSDYARLLFGRFE